MQADLAIVGAGTAGAAVAAFGARAGLDVVCFERRALGDAGARWVNGVPAWCFETAGLSLPAGDELRAQGHAFHLVSGWGPRRLTLTDHGVLEVDMRRLVERLQTLARNAGARYVERVRVEGLDGRELRTSAGLVRARWVVDASGLAGARLLDQPRLGPGNLCAAAQQVRRVVDARRAEVFFVERGATPGQTLCFTGIAGGYSIVNVRLDGEQVSLLTGSIPGDGHPSGIELLERFVREQAWIGEALFGGARAVPLDRPLDRLASERVALIGDAARQVFSAHGSGIGAGLVAARLLVDALVREQSLHAYARDWQRRYGGLFAAYDAFRRFSQRLAPGDVERLMKSGLLDEELARAGLEQRWPALGAKDLLSRLRGAACAPGLAARMAPVLAEMIAVLAAYARYPDQPERVAVWSRRRGPRGSCRSATRSRARE
jgi:flavin-dependent dehydrogenase